MHRRHSYNFLMLHRRYERPFVLWHVRYATVMLACDSRDCWRGSSFSFLPRLKRIPFFFSSNPLFRVMAAVAAYPCERIHQFHANKHQKFERQRRGFPDFPSTKRKGKVHLPSVVRRSTSSLFYGTREIIYRLIHMYNRE